MKKLFALITLMLPVIGLAGGIDTEANAKSSATTGDVNVAGDKGTSAFSWGAGDVDIGQCMFHKSFLVTWGDYNLWCMASEADRMGMHDAAAMARCQIKEWKSLFNSHDQCLFFSRATELPTVVEQPDAVSEEDEDDWKQEFQEQIAMLEQRLNEPKPAPVQRRVVEQKPFLTESQRRKLSEEILKK